MYKSIRSLEYHKTISLLIILDIDHIMCRITNQRRCHGSKHHQQLLFFSSYPHSTCYYHKASFDVIVVMDIAVCCMTTPGRRVTWHILLAMSHQLFPSGLLLQLRPSTGQPGAYPPKLSTSTRVCCWTRQQLTFRCIEDWIWVCVEFMKFILTFL